MEFRITEEQTMMVETARRIGAEYGLDYWRGKDARKEFPAEAWKAICAAGLCGVALPAEAGGSGLGMLDLAMVVEALCAGGGGSTLAQVYMCNPIFGGVSISRYGTERMKTEILPKIVSGEINCCMALTEPDAGSNSLALRTFARRDGDGWRLNGRKIWITAVDQAQQMLVVARTKKLEESNGKTDGISLFLIEVGRKGESHSAIEKLGTNTLSACNVFFDDVRLEPEDLVGTLDGGWRQLLNVLNTERIVTSAGLIGTVGLATRVAVEYASQRKVFGDTPVGAYQAVQFPLAQAHAEAECARLMNYKAAWLYDQGQPYGSQANMAKLIAARACSYATERAMQAMGGMGFAKESHLERLWRDCRLFRFAPVSDEMALNYVAQYDLGMPRSY